MSVVINRLAFILFMVAIVWAPIPYGSNDLWAEALLSLLALCPAILILIEKLCGQSSRYASTLLYAFAALVIAQFIVFLQYILTSSSASFLWYTWDPFSTKVALLTGCAYGGFFLAGTQLLNSWRRVRILLWVIVLSGFLQAVYGSLMTITGWEYGFFEKKFAYHGVATGTFVNRNHLAAYLVLAIVAFIPLMLGDLRKVKNSVAKLRCVLFTILLIGILVGLLLTQSRMGMISMLVSFGCLALLCCYFIKQYIKFVLPTLVSSVLVLVLSALSLSEQNVFKRIQNTQIQETLRLEILDNTLPAIKEHILFGTGAGTFYTVYPVYNDANAGYGFIEHAHNDYAEFLLERGVIGCLPLVIFVLITLWVVLKKLSSKNRTLQFEGIVVAMALTAISVHSISDFNLQIPAYALTLMALLSLAYTQRNVSQTDDYV